MIINPCELSARANYQLLIAALIPRPVAWVSTVSLAGIHNLAPFSFFAGVCATPVTMMIALGRRKGERKDTSVNLLERPECVVHIPSRSLAEQMVATSIEAAAEVDEFVLTGLEYTPADCVAARRLVAAPIAFECRVSQHLELGDGPNDIFFLEALRVHLDDSVLGSDGLPDAAKLTAVGRLGHSEYCVVERPFVIERPRTKRE